VLVANLCNLSSLFSHICGLFTFHFILYNQALVIISSLAETHTMDLMILFEHPSFESKVSSPTIILVTLLALVAGFYYKHKASKHAGKKLPPGSLGFPLVGESISLVRAQKRDKIDDWMWKRIDKFGPIFKTSIFGTKTVVLTGQAGNRFLFSGGDGISYKQPKTIASILGKYSLFEISGSRHKLIRGAIVGFLKPERIQKIVGEINSLVQQQLSKVPIELNSYITSCPYLYSTCFMFDDFQ